MENDMAKENAVLDKKEQLNEDLVESFDFDELEEKLQSQLEEELADMQFLAEEKEKIGNKVHIRISTIDIVLNAIEIVLCFVLMIYPLI